MKKILHYLKKILPWLLPHSCILCGYHSLRSQDLCEHCLNDLPRLNHYCYRCARPLPPISSLCGDCIKDPPAFNQIYALFLYQSPITKLIMNIKFGKTLMNARILGELLAHKIQTEWYKNKSLPEVIIPVPLHPLRLKQRGFNQALELARPVATKLNLPLDYKSSERIIHTVAQATLPAKQREFNIKNAFRVNFELKYDHIAVIDDVITTGHTIREFCLTLKASGIKTIDVWCCARREMIQ